MVLFKVTFNENFHYIKINHDSFDAINIGRNTPAHKTS